MDQIKGEVLVPASRFLPKCECGKWRHPCCKIEPAPFGETFIAQVVIICCHCATPYEQELPQGVEGIPHGQR